MTRLDSRYVQAFRVSPGSDTRCPADSATRRRSAAPSETGGRAVSCSPAERPGAPPSAQFRTRRRRVREELCERTAGGRRAVSPARVRPMWVLVDVHGTLDGVVPDAILCEVLDEWTPGWLAAHTATQDGSSDTLPPSGGRACHLSQLPTFDEVTAPFCQGAPKTAPGSGTEKCTTP